MYTGLAAAAASRASHVAESEHPWPELGKCHLHHHACSAKEKNVEIMELYSDLFRILACIKLGPSQKNVEPGKLILKLERSNRDSEHNSHKTYRIQAVLTGLMVSADIKQLSMNHQPSWI